MPVTDEARRLFAEVVEKCPNVILDDGPFEIDAFTDRVMVRAKGQNADTLIEAMSDPGILAAAALCAKWLSRREMAVVPYSNRTLSWLGGSRYSCREWCIGDAGGNEFETKHGELPDDWPSAQFAAVLAEVDR